MHPEGWYNVTSGTILKAGSGGNTILSHYYNSSMIKLLTVVYPEYLTENMLYYDVYFAKSRLASTQI